jgi:hypothetical protein
MYDCRLTINTFIAKFKIVERADESAYWLGLPAKVSPGPEETVETLLDEANQLVAIAASSIKTARSQRQ